MKWLHIILQLGDESVEDMAVNAFEFVGFSTFYDTKFLIRETFSSEKLGQLKDSVSQPCRFRLNLRRETRLVQMVICCLILTRLETIS